MGEPNKLIPFTPVPVRRRHDGWTVDKQYAFIEALAETGVVEDRPRAACPAARGARRWPAPTRART